MQDGLMPPAPQQQQAAPQAMPGQALPPAPANQGVPSPGLPAPYADDAGTYYAAIPAGPQQSPPPAPPAPDQQQAAQGQQQHAPQAQNQQQAAPEMSYTELAQKYQQMEQELAQTRAQQDQTRAPDAYRAPRVTVQDGNQTVEVPVDTDDPQYAAFQTMAQRSGITQTQFDALVGEYVRTQYGEAQAFHNNQLAMLGPDAEQRMNNVSAQLRAAIGDQMFNEFRGDIHTAGQFLIIEKLLAGNRGAGAALPTTQPAPMDANSLDMEISKMKQDKRYGEDQVYTQTVWNKQMQLARMQSGYR